MKELKDIVATSVSLGRTLNFRPPPHCTGIGRTLMTAVHRRLELEVASSH